MAGRKPDAAEAVVPDPDTLPGTETAEPETAEPETADPGAPDPVVAAAVGLGAAILSRLVRRLGDPGKMVAVRHRTMTFVRKA